MIDAARRTKLNQSRFLDIELTVISFGVSAEENFSIGTDGHFSGDRDTV
jgi:hypothetical protein